MHSETPTVGDILEAVAAESERFLAAFDGNFRGTNRGAIAPETEGWIIDPTTGRMLPLQPEIQKQLPWFKPEVLKTTFELGSGVLYQWAPGVYEKIEGDKQRWFAEARAVARPLGADLLLFGCLPGETSQPFGDLKLWKPGDPMPALLSEDDEDRYRQLFELVERYHQNKPRVLELGDQQYLIWLIHEGLTSSEQTNGSTCPDTYDQDQRAAVILAPFFMALMAASGVYNQRLAGRDILRHVLFHEAVYGKTRYPQVMPGGLLMDGSTPLQGRAAARAVLDAEHVLSRPTFCTTSGRSTAELFDLVRSFAHGSNRLQHRRGDDGEFLDLRCEWRDCCQNPPNWDQTAIHYGWQGAVRWLQRRFLRAVVPGFTEAHVLDNRTSVQTNSLRAYVWWPRDGQIVRIPLRDVLRDEILPGVAEEHRLRGFDPAETAPFHAALLGKVNGHNASELVTAWYEALRDRGMQPDQIGTQITRAILWMSWDAKLSVAETSADWDSIAPMIAGVE